MHRFKAWLVRGFPLNIFGPVGGRLGRFYDTNNVFKYSVGQHLRVAARNIVGYGVNARGTVVAHTKNRWGTDAYVIDMTVDLNVPFEDWMRTGNLPDNAVAETRRETHFKWNIEHQFVPVRSEEPAHARVVA